MKELLWGNPETIEHLKKELHNGSVILAEGDTVLGLLVDISEKGIAQLDSIKNRSKKPYLILVGDSKKVLKFIDKDTNKTLQIEKLMNSCWPGPVTLIFKAKQGVAHQAISADGTIALRVPDHAGLLKLLTDFDALFSTSANKSGQSVPMSIDQVDSDIMNAVACVVVNDVQNKFQSTMPSTIIDCTGQHLVLVREGAFDVECLKKENFIILSKKDIK